MLHTIKQIFHSPKFVVGFCIFAFMLVFAIVWPLFADFGPLDNVLQKDGGFAAPGTYVNVADAVEANADGASVKMNVDIAADRLAHRLSDEERTMMREWLIEYAGYTEEDLDPDDIYTTVNAWIEKYDFDLMPKTIKKSERNKYNAIDKKVATVLSETSLIVANENEEGVLEESSKVGVKSYVNVKDIASKYTFILGADNFGRDVLTELASSILTSLKIGIVAGCIATVLGLTLGLLAGYVGGFLDNIITFFTNLFTVIPGFVLLILIANAVGDAGRGVFVIALIMGLTSWPWTCRSVRSQVLSLRNRDHVNISKLSGHSLGRIVITDILPFVSSYVVMALILQISSGILSEAQLSMLGLGPATTEVTTLGLMMHWATIFNAHTQGMWWAYFPVILAIAFISFSLNLMNTGLDQVFNPQLRD